MKILGKILGVITTIITVVAIILAKKLDIIPDKYFLLIVAGVIVLVLILDILLFMKSKSTFSKVLKVIGIIVSIGYIVVCSYGIMYLNKTINFFNNIKVIKEEVTKYYVIVLDESRYQEMSDLDNTKMSYYKNTDKEVIDKIKLQIEYDIIDDDYKVLKDKLYNNEVDSILVSDIIKNIIDDEDKDFQVKTRILQTFDITKEIEDITKKVSIKNTPFNILITGIDTAGPINTVSRSDVNMIVTVNPNTNQVLLTSIPRDYYVYLDGDKSKHDKLTHSGVYGINCTVKTIEDLFDIDINYYVKVNFTTVLDLVDALGTIEIYSDANLDLEGCKYKKGMNEVDGKCALRFARERHSYAGGDRHRVKNQQEVTKGIFNKVAKDFTLITQYTDVLEALDGKFATNLDTKDAIEYIKFEMSEFPSYKIKNQQVDGVGELTKTYTYPYQNLYVMVPYEKDVKKAKKKIEKFLGKNVEEETVNKDTTETK